MALFNHNRIIRFYDLLEPQPGVFYLVMEYVAGGNLRKYLDDTPRLRPDEACKLMVQILEGFQAVHVHPTGIVHRDIKPSNILLTPEK